MFLFSHNYQHKYYICSAILCHAIRIVQNKKISRQFFPFLWHSSNDQLSVANSEDLFSLISFLMRSIQLQHIYRNFDNLLRKNLRLFIFHLHLMHKTFTIHGYLRPLHNWRRRRSDKIFVRLKKIRYGS